MGTGLVPLAIGCSAAASRLDAHSDPSLADAFGFIGLLGYWVAVLALGHALIWGPTAAPVLDLPARWPAASGYTRRHWAVPASAEAPGPPLWRGSRHVSISGQVALGCTLACLAVRRVHPA